MYLHIDFQDPNSFNAGDRFAFIVDADDTRNGLFAGEAEADRQDRVIFAVQDSNPELVYITQVDPPVSTPGDLRSLFNVASGSRNLNPRLTFQDLFVLNDNHTGDTGTYDWAHSGNTDPIPANKFESLSQAPGITEWADGSLFGRIDNDWLPTDLVREAPGAVTRTATTTTGETLVYGADGAIDLNLLPHVSTATVNVFDDVNFDNARTGNQVLQWDATEEEWILADESTGINLTEEAGIVPQDRIGSAVRITGGGLDFVANRYVVPDPSATLAAVGSPTRALFGGQTTGSLAMTFSNFVNTPDVQITTTGTGTAEFNAGASRIDITGLDSNTLNTFTMNITTRDGSGGATIAGGTGTRSISFTDQRGVRFVTGATTLDLAAGLANYLFTIGATGSGTLPASFTERLTGPGVSFTDGSVSPNGSIGLDQFINEGNYTVFADVTFDAIPRTVTASRGVSAYTAWFFWTQADAPTTAAEFTGRVGTTSIALGRTATSGAASADYYVALPTSAEVTLGRRFTYTLGTGAIITPSEVPASPIMRNGVEYRVYVLPNLAPNSNVTIT